MANRTGKEPEVLQLCSQHPKGGGQLGGEGFLLALVQEENGGGGV